MSVNYLECDLCNHKEFYENDNDGQFTDGKFWGIGKDNSEKIVCSNCLNENEEKNVS